MGFAIFACASLALSLDPLKGGGGALWLIGFRIVQAFGGSMLTANSAAILTDAFPTRQRGMALGINQITALAGQFLGLLAGGLLATIDWRAVFWVSVPIGVIGTIWSYRSLRDRIPQAGGRLSTGSATSPSPRAPAPCSGRHNVRNPALRRPFDRLDQPLGAGRTGRRVYCCSSCSASPRPGSRSRCSN